MRLTRAKAAVLALTCAAAIRTFSCSSAHVMEPEPPMPIRPPPSEGSPAPKESPPAPSEDIPDAGPPKERPGPNNPMRDSLQTRLARNP